MAPVDICPHRLLDTHTLQLVEFDETDTIPPYAILSHTWIHGQEVVYKEYVQHQHQLQPTVSLSKTSKSGYHKIQAACQKAREDGIGYIWIDTCCIKQGNHHDVAENVTCMYAYYQNAQVCYAYIADFHTPRLHNYGFSSSARDLFCWGSNWFQRGWTLQELLAPRTVVFFRKDWMCIGDKHELRDVIHHRTTIPPDILSGEQSIQDVDVLDRMSWSMGRETTRPQDLAYCLQGLLDVSIEPDYEEDWLTSFHRLRMGLFDAHPELEERLGIRNHYFYYLLMRRLTFVNAEKRTFDIEPSD
ncbi:hypothetical protein VKT23_016410 [Stygiomarasmius scandens]|uniref:Heterokaryon incompatibility domain-containing protein n=1 Tax=Marasmiellus scandens TaxID=2682957 RepID=A0ABR1IUS7_9AGAR